jgi:integrase
MKQNMTAKWCETVKPTDRQIDYFDQNTTGLVLRVSPGGRKAWSVFYRFHGKARRMGLGPYPVVGLLDARRLALEALRTVALDHADPGAKKRQDAAAETFAEVAALYLEKHSKPKKRSWREDERVLNRDLLPVWGNRKAAEIQRKDVRQLIEKLAVDTPVQANRVCTLISGIYNFAIDRELVPPVNPATRIFNANNEHTRDRVLSPDEIRILWRHLESETPTEAAVFRLGLLLGARKSELTDLPWNELDLDLGWWLLPAERSKNRQQLHLPLVGEALAILRRRRSETPEHMPLVFAGAHGRYRRTPLATVQSVAERLKLLIPDFRFHDLRRTFAAGCASIGIDDRAISRVLNHTPSGVTARHYLAYSYDNEKTATLTRWDRHVAGIINPEAVTSNVIELHAS